MVIYQKDGEKKYLILSALFGSFSFLSKRPGLAIYTVLGTLIFYELIFKKSNLFTVLKKYLPFILIVLLIPMGYFLRNIYYFNTPMCGFPLPIFKEECEKNTPKYDLSFPARTEEIGTETNVFKMGLMNYLQFAYGYILLTVFGFIAGLLIMIYKREKEDVFILIVLIGIIPLLLQDIYNRAEDTARYLLLIAPIISVLSGRYFSELYKNARKSDALLIILVLLSFLIPFISRGIERKILFVYYITFGAILFIGYSSKNLKEYASLSVFLLVLLFSFLNLKEKVDVMLKVKQFSPLYFKACDWIKENTPKDSVLMTIWSNRAVYNCQRNVVGNIVDISLSTDVNYTLNKTKEFGVTHIFLHKFSLSTEPMSEKYTVEFAKFLESHPEHFVNVFENGPKLDECLQMGGCDGNIVYEVKY